MLCIGGMYSRCLRYPPPSDYNKQEGVLYLLLEYAEMDLNAVIKKWNRSNHMINVLYFWSQMLLAVKVRRFQ